MQPRSARWSTFQHPARGVLFAHGSRFGGHALYIKNNRLHFVYNFGGMLEQRLMAARTCGLGRTCSFPRRSTRTARTQPHVSTGILSLYHGDRKVGEGRIRTQPGKFMIAGEGLRIGRDGGEPVTGDYPGTSPWPFTGGTINRVAVDVSGQPYVDLEREAVAMLMRE